jgi:hypothetical protein
MTRPMWIPGMAAYTGVDEVTFAKMRVDARVWQVARPAPRDTGKITKASETWETSSATDVMRPKRSWELLLRGDSASTPTERSNYDAAEPC